MACVCSSFAGTNGSRKMRRERGHTHKLFHHRKKEKDMRNGCTKRMRQLRSSSPHSQELEARQCVAVHDNSNDSDRSDDEESDEDNPLDLFREWVLFLPPCPWTLHDSSFSLSLQHYLHAHINFSLMFLLPFLFSTLFHLLSFPRPLHFPPSIQWVDAFLHADDRERESFQSSL